MKFFHISTFDKGIQKVLVPHVPDKTLWEEDIETKRISVCSNIDGCIAGISLNEYMYNEGKILIYEIEVDENMEHVFSWEVLYEKYNVYDAPFTHEYWVTCCVEPIKVYEGIVSNVKKNKYILASNVYKEKIICELKRLGLFEENMLRMNVFEISNYSGEHVKEAVKNGDNGFTIPSVYLDENGELKSTGPKLIRKKDDK